jgi:four helix bundle protein
MQQKQAIRSYEDLEAFKRAMALVRPSHDLAGKLPDCERFDLMSQIRRASKSIPANIAEGYGKRRSVKHFKAYLENALGSTNEMIVHIQVAELLEYGARRRAPTTDRKLPGRGQAINETDRKVALAGIRR